LISALKKHAVHNAITRINSNSLMQSKITLIGVTSSEFLFFLSIFVIISNKILIISAREYGAEPRKPKHFYLFIYILTSQYPDKVGMHYAKSRAINIIKAINIKQCKQAIEIRSGR